MIDNTSIQYFLCITSTTRHEAESRKRSQVNYVIQRQKKKKKEQDKSVVIYVYLQKLKRIDRYIVIYLPVEKQHFFHHATH